VPDFLHGTPLSCLGCCGGAAGMIGCAFPYTEEYHLLHQAPCYIWPRSHLLHYRHARHHAIYYIYYGRAAISNFNLRALQLYQQTVLL